MRIVRIATRKSPLAIKQATWVQQRLHHYHPNCQFELMPLMTTGDKHLNTPLVRMGGKGVFLKELEHALLNGTADMAVHSMKDVPFMLPEPLLIAAILPRANPFDVLVSHHHRVLDDLPANPVIGTASLRRAVQVRQLRPDSKIKMVRGNIQTRLNKLTSGAFDGLLLAHAGLQRLQLNNQIAQVFTLQEMVPAIGQGAIGVETTRDSDIRALLSCLHDPTTAACLSAERTLNQQLQGSCHSAIAAYCAAHNNHYALTAWVADPDGKTILHSQAQHDDPAELGMQVADDLLARGAKALLAAHES